MHHVLPIQEAEHWSKCSSNIGLRSAILSLLDFDSAEQNRDVFGREKVREVEDTRMSLIDQHLSHVFQARFFRSGAGKSSWTVVQPDCDVRYGSKADIATRTPTSLWGRSEHTSAALSPKSDSDTLRVLRIGPDVLASGQANLEPPRGLLDAFGP